MNPWPLVLADLRANRAGAGAIVLLIALAVALGVAVSAQERALRAGSARAAAPFDLVVGAEGSETQLVLSTVYLQAAAIDLMPGPVLAELAAAKEARLVAPIGFGDNVRGHPIVGTIPALVEHLAAGTLGEGRLFERIDEAVVGAGVADALGSELVPAHGQVHVEGEEEEHADFHYEVVGRLPPLGTPWDDAVIVPIEAVWWLHSLPLGHALPDDADLSAVPVGPPWDAAEVPGVPAIVVEPASFAAAYQLRQEYRARPGTTAVFPAEVLVQLYGLLGDVRDLLAIVSALTQILVIGAVLLAVLASLAQRRRQIGVLRALGASPLYIFTTVWLGVALMLAVAGLLGLLIGYGAAVLLAGLFEARTGVALPVALSRQELTLVMAIVGIGLLLATVPAALAYRGSVGAALRG